LISDVFFKPFVSSEGSSLPRTEVEKSARRWRSRQARRLLEPNGRYEETSPSLHISNVLQAPEFVHAA